MIKPYVFLFSIIFISNFCFCQSPAFIGKIEADKISTIYYINNDRDIFKKNIDSLQKVIRNIKTTNFDFFDISFNSNFILKDSFITSLRIEKNCLFCQNTEAFSSTPWIVFFECRNVNKTIKLPGGMVYLPSITPLNIEDKHQVLVSNNQIHFDFLHYKEKILLLLLADNILHIYENVGRINNNQWKLLKSFPSLLQTPFRGYVDSTDKISILFDSENVFSINFEEDYLKRIRKTINTNQCLFYNHKSKRYSWISQQEANGLINSNNPSDFIKRKLRSNDN